MALTREQYKLAEAYKMVFAGEDGQLVLADLRRLGNIDRPHLTSGDAIDPNLLIFYEAQRTLVLGIIHKIEMNLDGPKEETATSEE
jgi:hypothetical protein